MTTLLSTFQPIGGIDNTVDPSINPIPGTPELAIAPPNFAPGTTDTPISGPNPRTLSNVVSGGQSADGDNATTEDPTGASAWLYAFGQFVDHDLDLESVGTADISIAVPDGDPNFPNGTTIPLTRAITSATTGTALNTIAGSLDLSQIYGSDAATAASLRNPDGTLITTAGDALPIVNGAFVSGDARVDENPELTDISTLFVREHNYWVGVLKAENPSWTGDQLYNMARAITTAEYQNVIYTEYLPTLLGPNAIGNYTGFNPSVNTEVTQEFSTAAFRVGHSQVSGDQEGIDNNGNVIFSQTLADSFGDTPAQDEANGINSLLRDLSADNSQAVDVYAVDDLRNLLAASPDQMDLIAIDIQRERDLGLGTLNQTREAMGLTPYTSFAQLTSDPTVAANLQSQFGSIDNVDLFLGGLAENHAPGADVGQTFQAIIADQFNALRTGDQFFWQNENFDPKTAQMISQTTLADILERDTGTPAEQPNVFVAQQRHASDVAAADPAAPQLVMGVNGNGVTVQGGPADDTIVAGLGLNQILTGGGGSDVFQFNGGGHTDTITDWNANDTIQFQSSQTHASMSALMGHATVTLTDINGATKVCFDGNTITLAGVQASSLTAANFLLPPGVPVNLVVDPNQPHGGFMAGRGPDPHSGDHGFGGFHPPA
jgi:peroxidase